MSILRTAIVMGGSLMGGLFGLFIADKLEADKHIIVEIEPEIIDDEVEEDADLDVEDEVVEEPVEVEEEEVVEDAESDA